jgi:hypothetical protein
MEGRLCNYSPNVYFVEDNVTANKLLDEVKDHNYKVFQIEGNTISTKDDLLSACKEIMEFPFFGHNWSALVDCLIDMSWHSTEGFVVLYSGYENLALNDESSFYKLIEIFQYISIFRSTNEIEPFYILLKGDQTYLPDTIKHIS